MALGAVINDSVANAHLLHTVKDIAAMNADNQLNYQRSTRKYMKYFVPSDIL
jgi:hypothetical protein